ncbi:MAG: MarR family transcriptional regulator [Desulfobacteraceae bacterium]|nr:MarR family transcriptional regulator [Desulfobacteraceae bacterium]
MPGETIGTTLEQAKYIASTIRLIQDRLFSRHHGKFMSDKEKYLLKDLSISQFHAIVMIRKKKKVSLKELAAMQQISPPSASAMVNRLVEKGILKRSQCQSDRRKIEICLTEDALGRHEKVEKAVFASFVDLIEKLGPGTTRKWCAVLEQVEAVFKQEEDIQEEDQEQRPWAKSEKK